MNNKGFSNLRRRFLNTRKLHFKSGLISELKTLELPDQRKAHKLAALKNVGPWPLKIKLLI